MADMAKEELLAELGYGGDLTAALRAMEEAGLTNARKQRISLEKRDAVQRLLAERFIRVCNRGDCRRRAAQTSSQRLVADAASQDDCEICGGSAQRAAVETMVRECRQAGILKVCIVGGSPNYRQVLRDLVAGRLALRLIDGQTARPLRRAIADTQWADLVLIWGPTLLDHKVSVQYSGPHVIEVRRRGIAELAGEAATHARLRAGRIVARAAQK